MIPSKKLRMEQKEGTVGQMCHICGHLLHETERELGFCEIKSQAFA